MTATAILALVWLGAVLAVLQGFASSGPPSGVDASLVAHVTGMAAGYSAAAILILNVAVALAGT